mmetsp:Transcript_57849/g.126554  ORF Transcript_57849/g.126554 Transcript_57849/m.126554 type:complete len:90 (+) Transcript_57849:179-448(+)
MGQRMLIFPLLRPLKFNCINCEALWAVRAAKCASPFGHLINCFATISPLPQQFCDVLDSSDFIFQQPRLESLQSYGSVQTLCANRVVFA